MSENPELDTFQPSTTLTKIKMSSWQRGRSSTAPSEALVPEDFDLASMNPLDADEQTSIQNPMQQLRYRSSSEFNPDLAQRGSVGAPANMAPQAPAKPSFSFDIADASQRSEGEFGGTFARAAAPSAESQLRVRPSTMHGRSSQIASLQASIGSRRMSRTDTSASRYEETPSGLLDGGGEHSGTRLRGLGDSLYDV